MNTLLIVGFGDIARRALPLLQPRFRVCALLRPQHAGDAQAFPGVAFTQGDLDDPASLSGIAGRASHVVHLAPPPASGRTDPRTAHLLAALAGRPSLPDRIVYISTSGVYGDCAGGWVDEQRPPNPMSERAWRRLDAEQQIVAFGCTHGVRAIILRVPGIYAADRLPLERLRRATPVLRAEDDVYTNHIHADDLAAILAAALVHPDASGIYNTADDSVIKMGDWFDLLADRFRLPRPPRISRAESAGRIPPASASFMSESRRLSNARMKNALGIRLRYPTVYDGVPASGR